MKGRLVHERGSVRSSRSSSVHQDRVGRAQGPLATTAHLDARAAAATIPSTWHTFGPTIHLVTLAILETEDYPPFHRTAMPRGAATSERSANPDAREAQPRTPKAPMRADALRNRERLLDAAIELILEVGGEPSRDSLAEHAGVGIGTLYRHFPDQQSLLHAVVRHALERSIAAGEAALASTADGFAALRQYMHAAVDNGIGVVNLIYPLLDKAHPDLRARAESMINTMIERGRGEGRLRSDAGPADIVFATIRFSRPLAVGLSAADERAMAHRHIDIYVDGLGASASKATPRATRRSKGPAR